MIKGIGIDIVELARIERIVNRQPNFVKRILTEKERAKFATLKGKRQIEYLAGRFAAKEAFVKAVGTGISKEWSFIDIEILNNERGEPIVHSSLADRVFVSISHSDHYAVAQIIIESIES